MNPNIKVIGADPYGSIFKTFKDSGHVPEATPYLVEGIGQSLPVGNADMNVIDEIINITDRESFEMARQLSRREGIFCGGSTGTNFAAALKVAKDLDDSAVVVFIVCDTGEHYLTKFHSDEWMKEKLLLEPQKITAGLIAETKNLAPRRTDLRWAGRACQRRPFENEQKRCDPDPGAGRQPLGRQPARKPCADEASGRSGPP